MSGIPELTLLPTSQILTGLGLYSPSPSKRWLLVRKRVNLGCLQKGSGCCGQSVACLPGWPGWMWEWITKPSFILRITREGEVGPSWGYKNIVLCNGSCHCTRTTWISQVPLLWLTCLLIDCLQMIVIWLLSLGKLFSDNSEVLVLIPVTLWHLILMYLMKDPSGLILLHSTYLSYLRTDVWMHSILETLTVRLKEKLM